MMFFKDPFFWALISMFGLVGAGAQVGSKKLGKSQLFGIIVVVLFDLGRVMLTLPFCPQPRFEIDGWNWVVGGIIFATGCVFCIPGIPGLYIKPFTGPDEKMNLKTTGFYGIVRNPIYLGEVIWFLGWAVMFRSIIGLALVPIWWIALLFIILIEETGLERELGQTYLEYKTKVRGRIIPGLPI
ncbi:MAG: isoprenylcysteine carboxylmethyltransferase family protein [Deltaproteobacteria bacterium]|nr:MAG: isoprenylcysteine carboxylmethyltransferase family protein [Deltaproteobacteria bacterium]